FQDMCLDRLGILAQRLRFVLRTTNEKPLRQRPLVPSPGRYQSSPKAARRTGPVANAARARDTSSSDPWITFVDLDRKETLHRLVKEQRRIGAYLVVLIFDDFAVTTRSSAGELSDGHGLEHRSLRAEQRLPAFGFRVILSAFNMPDRVYLHPIDPGLL